jgi:hypothetical protein
LKKYLLPLLLFAGFIIGGLNQAEAANSITITNIPAAGGVTPNTTNLVVAEFSAAIVMGAGQGSSASINTVTFTSTGASAPSITTTTGFTLWQMVVPSTNAAPVFNSGSATSLENLAAPTSPTGSLSFDPSSYFQEGTGNTIYFFLTENFTVPSTAGNESFALTSSTWVNGNNNTFTPTYTTPGSNPGGVFTWSLTPTIMAANLTGLTAGPAIYYGASNIAVAGISLATSSGTATVSTLTFTIPQTIATASLYFQTVQIVTSTSPFNPAAYTVAGTVNLTGTTTVPCTITGTSANLTTTAKYYYLLVNYTAPGTQMLPKSFQFSATGYVTSLSTNPNTGYASNTYTCTAPSLTIATNTGGLANTTITGSESNIAIFGISATAVGSSSSITSLTFNTSSGQVITNYFPTVTLYSSNNSTYGSGTLTPLGVQTPAAGATSVTFTVAQTITITAPTYYYLVVSYTEISATPPPNFQFDLYSVSSTPTASLSSTTGQSYAFTVGTYNWVGGYGTGATRSDWNTAGNWSPQAVPGAFDVAQIGGPNNTRYYSYYPTVSANTMVGSISFNSNVGYTVYLIVNTGSTLTVNGDITLTGDNELATYFAITQVGLQGGGIIKAKDLNVNASYIKLGYNYNLGVYNQGVTLTLSANIALTSNIDALDDENDPNYYCQGGITTVSGVIQTTNTSANGGFYGYGTSLVGFSPTLTAAAPALLQLANANALSLSANGTNVIAFNVNYGTVEYSGASQTVYTDKAITGLSPGPSYYSLKFSGTGIKTPNSTTSGATITGNLDIAGDFTNALANDAADYAALSTSTVSSLGTTVIFNGTNVQQNLLGGAGNGTIFRNVNFSGTKTTLMNTGAFSIIDLGTLTMSGTSTNNVLNANGLLTLNSDPSGTATIATIPTGPTIQGVVNIQRYVTGNGNSSFRGYRLFSSPVNKISYAPSSTITSPNVMDLSYFGQTVNGNLGAYFAGPTNPGTPFSYFSPNAIIYLYDEQIVPGAAINKTFYSSNYVGITGYGVTPGTPWDVTTYTDATVGKTSKDASSNVVIPAGNGLLYYYIGNSQQGSTLTSTPPTSSTVTATGYVNQGTIPLYFWGLGGVALSSTLTYTSANDPTVTAYYTAPPGTFLLGNPYPATIDLQKLYTDNTAAGLSPEPVFAASVTFHQLDITSHNFDDYNAGLTSGAANYRYILSGQGFLVTCYPTAPLNTGVLYFKEDQKVLYANATFPSQSNMSVTPPSYTLNDILSPVSQKQTDDIAQTASMAPVKGEYPALRPVTFSKKVSTTHPIQIAALATKPTNDAVVMVNTMKAVVDSAAGAPICGLHLKLVQDSVNYDECGVYFNKTWSDKFDSNDSKDLDGNGSKVFLSSYSTDDVRTSINALSGYTNNRRVKLYAKFNSAGIFMLQMEDIKGVNTNKYSVFLLDKMLNDSLDLTLYKSYNFNYTPGTPNDSTRFVLAIEHKPIPHYALLVFSGQKSSQGVALDWKTVNEANYTTFVLQKLGSNNTYVFLDSLQSDSSGAYGYTDQHPVLGNNTYRLQQTDGLGNITYSAPVTIGYNSTSPDGGLTIYPNPSRSMITVSLATGSTATAVATADIYNTSGVLVEHKVVNSNSFTHDITSYNLGIYVIQLKNSNGVIVGKSKFVKVN